MNKLHHLHAKVVTKLVEIEEMFERAGVVMPNVTLFARNPNNDKLSIIVSSEKDNDGIRRGFEIVMKEASNRVEPTATETLKALIETGG